jgi:hypothetical protein
MKTNQLNRLKNTISYFMSIVFILSLASCNNQSTVIQPVQGCNVINTDFMQLYNQEKLRAGAVELETTDLHIHQYTFSVSRAKTICKIGYKGNATLFSTNKPYKIEIVNQAGIVVYTGSHLFQSNAIDYQSITPTVLLPNQSYTVKRIVPGTSTLAIYTIGTLVYGGIQATFPVSLNGLTITQSGFGSSTYFVIGSGVIPQIDIVFQ